MQSKKVIKSISELPTLPFTIDSMVWNQTGDWRYMTPLAADKTAPCSQGCPLGIPIPVYLNALRQGDWAKASRILYESNPLPAFTGRLCYHPCQGSCVRHKIDRSVPVRDLELFLSGENREIEVQKQVQKGRRVLIVGSGPLGLACAFFLGRQGCRVRIVDPSPRKGGIFRNILARKIDGSIIDLEIDKLVRLAGIELELNVAVDARALADLKKSFELIILDPTGLPEDLLRPEGASSLNPFDDQAAEGDILAALLPGKWLPLHGPKIAHYLAAGRLTAEKARRMLDPEATEGTTPARRNLPAEAVKPGMIIGGTGSEPRAELDVAEWNQTRALQEAERCLSCGTCNLCRQCISFCPDASLNLGPDGDRVEIDLAHCKGCGICAYECPRGVITLEENQL